MSRANPWVTFITKNDSVFDLSQRIADFGKNRSPGLHSGSEEIGHRK